jgi:hypothetical protein
LQPVKVLTDVQQNKMKVEKFYLPTHTKFGKSISEWAQASSIEIIDFHERNLDDISMIDGLVIFTENQSVEKEASEARTSFDQKQKPIHKIDINGTLVAAVSNFTFWIERNNCKSILCIGADQLINNPNLERFLSNTKF